jgi:hypothetical protein
MNQRIERPMERVSPIGPRAAAVAPGVSVIAR